MKDDVYLYNHARWEALAQANALFTRPRLDLDRESARDYLALDRLGIAGELTGKKVLCLASGGGQQSAAFGLLGAVVTVFDISASQLERDRAAAEHYGYEASLVQGDMRDLSCFDNDSFDIVWHPYSLTFVPDARDVFREVSRIVKTGGIYHLMCANPFFAGLTHQAWNGEGYLLNLPYEDGTITSYPDQEWVYDQSRAKIQEPVEYRQTLSRIMNGLIREGFILTYIDEIKGNDPEALPGSWGHFTDVAPPWLEYTWLYLPNVLKNAGTAG
ncbi:class I SAM-dependent methyltransferase [Paenibacillus sacheonensis]|uniref:Methyltransferase domain-containing protein n=1 Tax=Paenibacillus sacheonensis TaxID=742054 RepID=A0A7X5C1F0_9BACL|nr:class I SAM-dependent methyltransferase [Paenibacillus sacheonensis]MBM7568918.1 SAM-dependent methyltransferase [Paenibacillus sacheonensis]NBC72707.1 methyltransferase domain-containing protein [Paenibacillus sacheonensis]